MQSQYLLLGSKESAPGAPASREDILTVLNLRDNLIKLLPEHCAAQGVEALQAVRYTGALPPAPSQTMLTADLVNDLLAIRDVTRRTLLRYPVRRHLETSCVALSKLRQSRVEVPGQYTGRVEPSPISHVTIARVGANIHVCARNGGVENRVVLVGSDESVHEFSLRWLVPEGAAVFDTALPRGSLEKLFKDVSTAPQVAKPSPARAAQTKVLMQAVDTSMQRDLRRLHKVIDEVAHGEYLTLRLNVHSHSPSVTQMSPTLELVEVNAGIHPYAWYTRGSGVRDLGVRPDAVSLPSTASLRDIHDTHWQATSGVAHPAPVQSLRGQVCTLPYLSCLCCY